MKAEALPQGWISTTLDDVAKWGSGGTPSRKFPKFFNGSIPWFKTGELGSKIIVSAEEHITEEAIKKSSAKIFPKGAVGIAMYGATIGKLSIWGIEASTNQACAVAQPYGFALYNEFLYFFLLSEKKDLIKSGKGGAQPNISQGILKEWLISLPPINEQRRIVAKIEQLFSELDKGIENLKKARTQLKVYRQAVLKHAFEGKLTEQWRKDNADKLETADQLLTRIQKEREARYQQQLNDWKKAVKKWESDGKEGKKPVKPRKVKELRVFSNDEVSLFPVLPYKWNWVKIDNICEHNQYAIKAGPFGSALKKEFYVADGYKVYGQEQVISGDHNIGNYYVNNEKYKELSSCAVKPFDVLISLVGTVGKVLVLPEDSKEGIINPRLIKISINSSAYLPEFFKYYFESAFLKSLYKLETHGATMDVLNLGIIQTLPFPLCDIKEQQQLVNVVESKLSVIDRQEQDIENILLRAETLRQSILKKAFSGQLVEQDPNDEPASVLLERIKAEKEKQKTSAAKKKSTSKRKSAA